MVHYSSRMVGEECSCGPRGRSGEGDSGWLPEWWWRWGVGRGQTFRRVEDGQTVSLPATSSLYSDDQRTPASVDSYLLRSVLCVTI